jgi:hypothetical protein
VSNRTFVIKFSHSRSSNYVCKNLFILARFQILTTRLNSFGTRRSFLALQPYTQRQSVTFIRFTQRCIPIHYFAPRQVTRSLWFLIVFIFLTSNLTPWTQTRCKVFGSFTFLTYVLVSLKWSKSKLSYWQISDNSEFPGFLLKKGDINWRF